jgi:hypothetical protein
MMDDNDVSGLMALFLYGIDKAPDLGPSIVDLMADDLINQLHYRQPVQEYFDAFGEVVRRGQIPPHAMQGVERYSQAEVLDFVNRLYAKLDQQRPWPKPRFTRRDLSEWPSFANARGIARIAALPSVIEGAFRGDFGKVPTGSGNLPVMIVELRSGEMVAIMGSTERGSRTFTLLARDATDPAATIAAIRDLTGLGDDEVVPL